MSTPATPKTIEYHLAHIFAKLGIRTRYQLAARVGPNVAALVR
jgi:DNA-binding CsgD family transcriptional regulator